jgi:uncharacterized protein
MSNDNVPFIQGLYAAFGRGDIATIVKAMAPDIHWQSGGSADDFPTFGTRKGQKQAEQFFQEVATHNEFLEFSPREFYATGDKMFVLGFYDIKLRKNGRKIASDWVHVFTIKDDKVTAFREFLDTAVAARAFHG